MKLRLALTVLAVVALAACGDSSSFEGGGRGAPGGGGGGGGDPAADDLDGTEVPPDPAFDEDTEDPPADPE